MARRALGPCTALATAPCLWQSKAMPQSHTSEVLTSVLRCGVARKRLPEKKMTWHSTSRLGSLRTLYLAAIQSAENTTHTTAEYTSFSRYTHPYLPPDDRHTWAPEFHSIAEALTRHDDDACWSLLQEYRTQNLTLPFSVWYGVCALTAQAPASQPLVGLYARLDRVCRRLVTLFHIHTEEVADPVPVSLYRRFVYLLLKRAERLDLLQGDGLGEERIQQAKTLWEAVEHKEAALDTPLLGRVVFRLARMGNLSLRPFVDAYVARSDLLNAPGSAAQPFNAIVAACAGSPGHPRPSDADLLLGVDALRLAYERELPIKGTVVQTFLLRLGPARTRMLLHACGAPSCMAPACANTSETWSTALHHLAQTRPTYLAQRAAVSLCRSGDPRAALALMQASQDVPYDVYAAAISALTWHVRERRAGSEAAMILALRTLDRLSEHPEYEADQQMYSETIRAFEAALHGRKSPKPDALAADLALQVHEPPKWLHLMQNFTKHLLNRLEEGLLLPYVHHTRLLAMNISLEQYQLGKRLYEQARAQFVTQLPFFGAREALPQGMSWLFAQALRHPGQLSFAIRLYHDAAAFGYQLTSYMGVQFVQALLTGGMPTVAQQIVMDMCTLDEARRTALAPGVLRAFFQANLLEPALSLAEMLYATPPASLYDEQQAPTVRLDMYAVCLYEASRMPLIYRPEVRTRLWALFEEFRLALAHALAHRTDDDATIRATTHAYHGAIRLRIVEHATSTEIQHLLNELRDLVGATPTVTSLVQHVPCSTPA